MRNRTVFPLTARLLGVSTRKFSPAFFKRRRSQEAETLVAHRRGRHSPIGLSFCEPFLLALWLEKKKRGKRS